MVHHAGGIGSLPAIRQPLQQKASVFRIALKIPENILDQNDC
jgi:hypothetical protein